MHDGQTHTYTNEAECYPAEAAAAHPLYLQLES